MSNEQTTMKSAVNGVNQPSAKLIETDATSNDNMKQSVETVTNPQGMENNNTNGLFANYLVSVEKFKSSSSTLFICFPWHI